MQLYEMNSVLSLNKNKKKMFPKVHSSPLAQNPSFKTMKPCIDCTQMRNMEDKFAPQGNLIMFSRLGQGMSHSGDIRPQVAPTVTSTPTWH